jgi:hypothetical protein
MQHAPHYVESGVVEKDGAEQGAFGLQVLR